MCAPPGLPLPHPRVSACAGILFRVGLLVGNASEVTRLNATTYSFSGPRRFDINLVSANGSAQGLGKAHLLAQARWHDGGRLDASGGCVGR